MIQYHIVLSDDVKHCVLQYCFAFWYVQFYFNLLKQNKWTICHIVTCSYNILSYTPTVCGILLLQQKHILRGKNGDKPCVPMVDFSSRYIKPWLCRWGTIAIVYVKALDNETKPFSPCFVPLSYPVSRVINMLKPSNRFKHISPEKRRTQKSHNKTRWSPRTRMPTRMLKNRKNTYLSHFPTNPLVGHPDVTHWGDTLVGHPSYLTLLLDTLLRHSYLTLLTGHLVRHSYWTLLLDTPLGHSYLTFL